MRRIITKVFISISAIFAILIAGAVVAAPAQAIIDESSRGIECTARGDGTFFPTVTFEASSLPTDSAFPIELQYGPDPANLTKVVDTLQPGGHWILTLDLSTLVPWSTYYTIGTPGAPLSTDVVQGCFNNPGNVNVTLNSPTCTNGVLAGTFDVKSLNDPLTPDESIVLKQNGGVIVPPQALPVGKLQTFPYTAPSNTPVGDNLLQVYNKGVLVGSLTYTLNQACAVDPTPTPTPTPTPSPIIHLPNKVVKSLKVKRSYVLPNSSTIVWRSMTPKVCRVAHGRLTGKKAGKCTLVGYTSGETRRYSVKIRR